jgi:hypothetical protein
MSASSKMVAKIDIMSSNSETLIRIEVDSQALYVQGLRKRRPIASSFRSRLSYRQSVEPETQQLERKWRDALQLAKLCGLSSEADRISRCPKHPTVPSPSVCATLLLIDVNEVPAA